MSRSRSANNRIVFCHRDGDAVSAGESEGALCYQLQHFVQNEVLELPDVIVQRFAVFFTGTTLAYLLVQSREREQSLERFVSKSVAGRVRSDLRGRGRR